jgi:hypothetical protein
MHFDRGRWKRFDRFKTALDILKGRGLEASDVPLADAAADLSDWPTADEFWNAVAAWRARHDDALRGPTSPRPRRSVYPLRRPQLNSKIVGSRQKSSH